MDSNLRNLWLRRQLLKVIVVSNIKRQSKNSTLGYVWWLLDPILMAGVYYLIMAIFLRHGSGDQPYLLFLLCGLISWKAFSDSVSQSIQSIRSSASLVRAIGFPKAVLPLSLVFSNTIFFFFGLFVVMVLAWIGGRGPTLSYLMLPLIVVQQVLFTIGIVLIMATIGVFFRDAGNIMGHVLRMWYFLSPGVYSVDRIPVGMRPFFRLNPFCELMNSYRDILIDGKLTELKYLGYSTIVGIVCCCFGFYLFKLFESRFVQKL